MFRAERLGELAKSNREDLGVPRRVNRHATVVTRYKKRAALIAKSDVAALKRLSVRAGKNRQQHTILRVRVGFQRVPVDVEVGGKGRARAVFQDVGPPIVAWVGDAHVIRDEVEDEAHPSHAQLVRQPVEISVRAKTWI